MKVPKNIIIESKYTQGNEYMFKNTYKKYQGYYYEMNGKLFAGKEFNIYAPELIKIDLNKINNLLTKPSTYIFGKLSNKNISSETIHFLPISNSDESFYEPEVPLFFCKKINESPIRINRISEETYISLQKNSIYQTTFIGNYKGINKNIEEADKQMSGLKAFLEVV